MVCEMHSVLPGATMILEACPWLTRASSPAANSSNVDLGILNCMSVHASRYAVYQAQRLSVSKDNLFKKQGPVLLLMPSDSKTTLMFKVCSHTVRCFQPRLQLCTVMLCWQVKMTVTVLQWRNPKEASPCS